MNDAIIEREKMLGLDGEWKDLLSGWTSEVQDYQNRKSRRSIADDELYSYERGMIGKKEPNLPFKGSSDIRFRSAAEDIRKVKPNHIGAILNAPHIVRLTSSSGASARLEQYYDWLYRYWMKNFRERVIAACHTMLSKGRSFVKVTWECEVESYSKILEVDQQLRDMMKGRKAQQTPQGMIVPAVPPATDEMLMVWAARQCDWDLDDPSYEARAKSIVKQLRAEEESPEFVRAIVDRYTEGPSIIPITNLTCLTFDHNVPIQEGDWINEEIYMSERDLRSKSLTFGGRYKNVEKLLEEVHAASAGGNDDKMQKPAAKINADGLRRKTLMDLAQGINDVGEIRGFVRLFERHCYVKQSLLHRDSGINAPVKDEDDAYVKAIITYCPDIDPDIVGPLRAIEYPYDFDGIFRWCYWQFRYNDTGEGPMSGEGIVEMGLPYQIEENAARNGAIDRSTLIAAPRRFVRKNSGLIPGIHKPVGQDIEVNGDPSTVSFIEQMPALNTPLLQDAEIISQRRKELVGIGDVTAIGAYDRPPTKGQVDAFMQPYSGVQNFEIGNWLEGWGRIFQMVHLLCKQFLFLGRSDKQFNFGSLDDGRPVSVNPADFAGDYIVFSGGDIMRGDPQLSAQKMQAAIASTANNPIAAAMVKPYYMYRRYLNDFIGPAATSEVLETPEKAEQYKQQLMQMVAQQMAQAQMKQQNTQQRGRGRPPSQLGGGGAVQGPNMGMMAGNGQS